MSQPARGLGKGLSAILGNVPGADELRGKPEVSVSPTQGRSAADVLMIPLGEIEPNPFQPRQTFDREELDGLAASIKSLGLITPVTVRRIGPSKYQIISGERRFRACQMAGLTEIPAYVREANDQGMLEMAIVENIQRANLDPIEVALSYQRLMDECNLTQEAMAERLGKSRSSVANQLRLLKLPVKVQHDLKVGLISVGHAKVLLGVEDPDMQVKLCDLVVKNGLNVRQLEQKVAAIAAAGSVSGTVSAGKKVGDVPQVHKDLCREVAKYFKGEISVRRRPNGKGTLTINFSSDSEIGGFLDALKK
ncbi:MAG: ParB/RepB/Spo0J family partition protein [Bacteroidales bacterium]|nr:ParB/RepB/Spo0J family partition protein [Bacteroidales bacterium]